MSIQLRSHSDNTTKSDIFIMSESTKDRNKRILKTYLTLGAVFLISIFVPVVHFVVPPLCVALGIIFTIKNLGSRQTKIVGTGICPECKKEFPIAELTTKFPVRTFCPLCRNQIYIEKN